MVAAWGGEAGAGSRRRAGERPAQLGEASGGNRAPLFVSC